MTGIRKRLNPVDDISIGYRAVDAHMRLINLLGTISASCTDEDSTLIAEKMIEFGNECLEDQGYPPSTKKGDSGG